MGDTFKLSLQDVMCHDGFSVGYRMFEVGSFLLSTLQTFRVSHSSIYYEFLSGRQVSSIIKSGILTEGEAGPQGYSSVRLEENL